MAQGSLCSTLSNSWRKENRAGLQFAKGAKWIDKPFANYDIASVITSLLSLRKEHELTTECRSERSFSANEPKAWLGKPSFLQLQRLHLLPRDSANLPSLVTACKHCSHSNHVLPPSGGCLSQIPSQCRAEGFGRMFFAISSDIKSPARPGSTWNGQLCQEVKHKQTTPLLRDTINRRQVLYNPENLRLLLSWGKWRGHVLVQMQRDCCISRINTWYHSWTEAPNARYLAQLLFSHRQSALFETDEIEESIVAGSSTKSMQTATSTLGAELETQLLERGAVDIDVAYAEADTAVNNGYLLENSALADVLFSELEHRLDASSDSGSEQDVLDAFECPTFSSACGTISAVSK